MSDKSKAIWMIFDVAIATAVGLIIFHCIAGCTFSLKDNGEIGFRQSTTWGFFHETSKSQSSESKFESPSLVHWIMGDNQNSNDNVSFPPPATPVKPDDPVGGGSP